MEELALLVRTVLLFPGVATSPQAKDIKICKGYVCCACIPVWCLPLFSHFLPTSGQQQMHGQDGIFSAFAPALTGLPTHTQFLICRTKMADLALQWHTGYIGTLAILATTPILPAGTQFAGKNFSPFILWLVLARVIVFFTARPHYFL